jgi:hypothetical protein
MNGDGVNEEQRAQDQQQNAAAPNGRKERSDKGQPRLYIEALSTRFDLADEGSRDLLRNVLCIWAPHEGEKVCAVFEQMYALIDRLRK